MTERGRNISAHERRRGGLARVVPVTVGIAALGGAATATVAVGLAMSRPAHAASSPIATTPASRPTGAATSGPLGAGPTTPAAPRAGTHDRHRVRRQVPRQPQQVAPATQAPPSAKSQGS